MITELVVIEKIKPLELFTGENIEPFLKDIEGKVLSVVPDIESPKGRKEIASLAYKVAQSKKLIDGLGKDLVADWKAKAKKVDAARKFSRDFLDNLRDTVRQPLTEWEDAEKAKIEAEELARAMDIAHAEAIEENKLFDRHLETKRKEAELAEKERKLAEKEEKLRRQEADAKRKKEQVAREDRLRKEAAETAKREAEEKAKKEREAAKAAAEQAERDLIAAAEKADREKKEAVEAAERKAREEAERKEMARKAKEGEERREAEAKRLAAAKKAADSAHREKINSEAIIFIKGIRGVTEAQATDILFSIAAGDVPHVTVNY